MNQYWTPLSRRRQFWTPLIMMVVMANLVVACSLLGGGDSAEPYPAPDESGDVVLPGGGPTLTCSQECADRGQCGQSSDRGRVVLLSAAQPSVSALDHDLAIAEGASVSVLETRSLNVTENASGFEFPVNFYHVLVQDRNVEGWVAGWCILNPQS